MMVLPTKWETLKEFVKNLLAGAVFFGAILLVSWALRYGIDKQIRIEEQQQKERPEAVRL